MTSGRRRILLAEITAKVPQTSVPATWNPSDKAAAVTLSGSNLIATKSTTGSDWACVRGTVPMLAGQWYWETTVAFTGTADFCLGIALGTASLTVPPASVAAIDAGGIRKGGAIFSEGNSWGSTVAITSGSVIRHWFDADAGTYQVSVNGGSWFAMSATTLRGAFPVIGISTPVGTTCSITANFGSAPFAYAVPDSVNPGVYTVPAAQPISLYLSSEALATNTMQYDARIAGDDAADVEIERAGSCYVWGSQSVSRRGKLVLINADGALDAWATYEWRDASVNLRSGYEGDAAANFTTWAFARVDSIAFTESLRVELTLADPLALLDRALQTALYPADQPNAQLAGKPVPIVYGAPMYCAAARLNTDLAVRDYQLHDGIGAGLDSITDAYDRGDRFAGPNDLFVPHAAITSANGGDFTGWAGTPSVPTGWTALTPYGATTDRFFAGSPAGARIQSHHNPSTAIQHGVALHANTRYQLTFTVASVPTAGILTFAAGSVTLPVALSTTGAQTIPPLDVAAAAKLELRLDGTPLDVTITSLRATSVQVVDWTYYAPAHGPTLGFTLANAPAGKVVANPMSGIPGSLSVIADDVCNTRFALPDLGVVDAGGMAVVLPQVDMDSALLVQARAPYAIATYIDAPKTALVLLREIMDGVCGWITSNRYGQIVFGRVEAPSNTPELTLDTTNVLGEITMTDDLAKGLTIKLSGRRNHSPHADGDIADSVTPAMRAELQTEMTLTRTGAPLLGADAVSAAYTQAVNAPARATLLQRGIDLQAEANRIATLWRPVRKFYQLTALLDASAADSLEPGQTIRLVWPRYGLDAGRNLFVVGVRSRFFSRRVDLTLWG